MFPRERIGGIIADIFRAELVRCRRDAFAFFDDKIPLNLADISPEVRAQAAAQAGFFFAFEPRAFSSLAELTEQAFDAYRKNHFVQLATSGSTGTPKACVYPLEMMEEEARIVGKHFCRAKRFITLTPRQHLYGLSFAVFFPWAFDIPADTLPPVPIQPWHDLLKEGDVLAGFPLFWEYFLKGGNTLPAGVTAVTSTAPCPKGLFARLKAAGAAQVIELYGATETGGIGVRYNEEDPFDINAFWEVRPEGDSAKIRRKGIDGWLAFPDQVQFVPPRGLFPRGRIDRVVQVAGVNVSLSHVEHVLQEYPAVEACRVRLMRPEEGKRLKAFIVLKQGTEREHLAPLRAFLAARLSSHEMPRAFTFGEQLPVSAMGKASDW